MDFQHSLRVQALCAQMREFIEQHIAPANAAWHVDVAAHRYPLAVLEPLKAKARALGLWNLFLPSLGADDPGTGLSHLEYAPLAELMGRWPWAAEVFNCSAPDTGNMELLHLFATPEQRKRWLQPLLQGQTRSAVCITEPDVASSDPTNVHTRIVRDGADYVINGHKWFVTGALHPHLAFMLVLGCSEGGDGTSRHARHTWVLVPVDTPGLKVVRDVAIMHQHTPEGHCEVRLENVRVPVENRLGDIGAGFVMMQARLGPGRVHHCMRTIGQCELALELMCERALNRRAFGKQLAEYANLQDWIAHSRIAIDQARLLVLHAAWLMDQQGNKAARTAVSAIKVVAARLQTEVLDRAIQVFGACGLTPDTPLAALWAWGRALHFIDGPDEVHLRGIARAELDVARAAGPRNAGQCIYNAGVPLRTISTGRPK